MGRGVQGFYLEIIRKIGWCKRSNES